MKPKILELRPNRDLLNPNFDGYKLSLTTLTVCEKDLPASVDRASPDAGQYSFLHARLFGLHNHIFAEDIHGISYIYFVDKQWRVWKLYLEPFLHQFAEPVLVFQIPKDSERLQGQYNITLTFVTKELAAISDSCGVFYLLNTGDRSSDTPWSVAFRGDIFDRTRNFVIRDVLCTDENELHLLALKIDQDASGEHWINVLNWVVLSFRENTWIVTAIRELQAKGELYYCYFEKDGRALYISSENSFKFVMDSEEDTNKEESVKKYVGARRLKISL